MSMADLLVYAHPDGKQYVALFEGELGWQSWPAEAGGWERRIACPASTTDDCDELPPELARLALRLSGVPDAG
jgi:hypothetical protein